MHKYSESLEISILRAKNKTTKREYAVGKVNNGSKSQLNWNRLVKAESPYTLGSIVSDRRRGSESPIGVQPHLHSGVVRIEFLKVYYTRHARKEI